MYCEKQSLPTYLLLKSMGKSNNRSAHIPMSYVYEKPSLHSALCLYLKLSHMSYVLCFMKNQACTHALYHILNTALCLTSYVLRKT